MKLYWQYIKKNFNFKANREDFSSVSKIHWLSSNNEPASRIPLYTTRERDFWAAAWSCVKFYKTRGPSITHCCPFYNHPKMAKKNVKITIGQGEELVDLNYADLRQALLTLRAIDHEIRQKIIKVLQKEESLTVTEIFVSLRIEQSVASQHLAIMRKAGVVFSERHGKFIHYSLNEEKLSEIARLVDNLMD